VTGLDAFFTEMKPFLLGERSATDVLARLGPSMSGAGRFALYAELVARQRRSIIDHFYRAAGAAAETHTPGLFGRLRDQYLREHPPTHWAPNEAARGFPDYLTGHREATDDLVALADFAWARFAVMHAPHVHDEVGLDDAILVRHYDCDVAAFSEAVERQDLTQGLPRLTPRTLLLGRHRRQGTLVVTTPSLGALIALAVASGRAQPLLPAGLTAGTVLGEARALEALGLVPAGLAERLGPRLA